MSLLAAAYTPVTSGGIIEGQPTNGSDKSGPITSLRDYKGGERTKGSSSSNRNETSNYLTVVYVVSSHLQMQRLYKDLFFPVQRHIIQPIFLVLCSTSPPVRFLLALDPSRQSRTSWSQTTKSVVTRPPVKMGGMGGPTKTLVGESLWLSVRLMAGSHPHHRSNSKSLGTGYGSPKAKL